MRCSVFDLSKARIYFLAFTKSLSLLSREQCSKYLSSRMVLSPVIEFAIFNSEKAFYSVFKHLIQSKADCTLGWKNASAGGIIINERITAEASSAASHLAGWTSWATEKIFSVITCSDENFINKLTRRLLSNTALARKPCKPDFLDISCISCVGLRWLPQKGGLRRGWRKLISSWWSVAENWQKLTKLLNLKWVSLVDVLTKNNLNQ